MPYLGSLVVALAALLAVAAVLLAVRVPWRRLHALRAAAAGDVGERSALLGARVAALRARRAGTWRTRATRALAEAPTIEMARSDRGSTP